jgi:hypothetical protein
MNRAVERVFHSAGESSFVAAVNVMWKLCKAGEKSGVRSDFTTVSEEFGTDF